MPQPWRVCAAAARSQAPQTPTRCKGQLHAAAGSDLAALAGFLREHAARAHYSVGYTLAASERPVARRTWRVNRLTLMRSASSTPYDWADRTVAHACHSTPHTASTITGERADWA